jgi:cardiolipin synthase A/B
MSQTQKTQLDKSVHEADWKFYTKNDDAWADMLKACANATKSIDLEQYIFVPDEIGKKFIDICAEKASQGIRVRFLWDAAGSWNLFGQFIVSDLSRRGIQVAFFNRFIPRALHNHRWWFFRNHRRSLIIDSSVAFTGSICMWRKSREWRDTHIRLTGAVVREIEQAFERMWDRAHGIKRDWGDGRTIAHQGFHYITNSPIRGRHFMYDRLIDAIRGAKKYILLTTPYMVPDIRLLRVLRLAVRRGVSVRILIPKSSDYPIVDLGARSFFTKMLKAGIRIYRYSGNFIHSKTGVIDGEWATVGTMNLDNVSLRYNFEANVVSTDIDFAMDVEEFFRRDLSQAEELTLAKWEERGFVPRFFEFLVRFIRKFL